MGLRQRVIDWLGRTVADSGASPGADSGASPGAAVAPGGQCAWMEQARRVMASWVISALQLCEIKFYGPDGRPTMDDAAWLWNVSPNPNQSRAEFLHELLGRLLVDDGRAVAVPVRSGGRTSLYVADGGSVPEVRPGLPALYSNVSVEGATTVVPGALTSDDVYAFDMRGVGGGWATADRAAARMYDEVAAAMVGSAKDRAGRKWLLHLDRPPAGTAEQQAAIERQTKSAVADFVRSDDGVMPLYKGQSMERASADVAKTAGQTSADVISMRRDMFALVAGCFHMPASLLDGDMNNFEATMSAFLTFAVDPVARMLSEEITRKSYTQDEWRRGAHAVVDTTHVRHVDVFQVADAAAKLVGSTVDSPNEIRAFTRQDPISEPWADEYQRTKNNEPASGGESDAL